MKRINHTEYEWLAEDGTRLYGQSWKGEHEPRAVLCLVHGLGEHSSRYGPLGKILINSDISMVAIDLRGHGRSEGKRGHFSSYDAIMSDINLLINKTALIFPDKKIFLYGNSMGGNLAINYVLRSKTNLSGVILTAPWLKLSHPPGILQQWVARKIHAVWPDFTTIHGFIHFIKQKVIFWDRNRDRQLHRWISVNTFLDVTKAGEWALSKAELFPHPVLIIHGGFDKVTSIESNQEFISKVKTDKSFKILNNLCHNIHSEKESSIIFNSIAEWIENHLC